jgi:hypothetical protein
MEPPQLSAVLFGHLKMIIELAIASAIAAGPISDLKQLKAYTGHNVWDRVKGAQSFLDTRAIKAQIGSLLSANEIARLRELEVGDDVEIDEGYAFANFCRPHDCPSDHAVVAVSLRDGATYVGFWGSRSGAEWISRGARSQRAPEDLPCAVLAAFHFGHVMAMTDDDYDSWCGRIEPAPDEISPCMKWRKPAETPDNSEM